MKMSPIKWYSKKWLTIETLVFGTEFVAMRVGVETLCAIWYKLRMMGISISGASYIYGHNMSVIHNTSKPDSMLKKSNAIAIMPSMSFTAGMVMATCVHATHFFTFSTDKLHFLAKFPFFWKFCSVCCLFVFFVGLIYIITSSYSC